MSDGRLRKWLVLLCMWLGCSQGSELETASARLREEQAVPVGRAQELREVPPRDIGLADLAPRLEPSQPLSRASAARAWREAPSQDSAWLLARAYFPEFARDPESDPQKAPLSPEAALRVRMPASGTGEVEVVTRGHAFRVRPLSSSGESTAQSDSVADPEGERHFWRSVGGQRMEQEALWLTQRIEEFAIVEAGSAPYRASYEVEVPEGIEAVRDVGEYLEFLDKAELPVVRLHYALARDAAGHSRQGQVRLWGARPEAESLPEAPRRLALQGRTLRVEMEVGLEGLEGLVVVAPGWSSTGAMATARMRHAATLLPNGKVLVTGGNNNTYPLASAELYDPVTGTWSGTGSLIVSRDYHTATLLQNGKVLVAAGYDGYDPRGTAELYDPATGVWSATGSLSNARFLHTATLLQNGKVFVAFGGGPGYTNPNPSGELYDPATGLWSSAGSAVLGGSGHTATLLSNGKVLLAGGSKAVLYDPTTGSWTTTGSLGNSRSGHTATLLPNGRVLVAGGKAGGPDNPSLATAELYDPASGTWTTTGMAVYRHNYHAAALFPTGKVLVVAGHDSNSTPLPGSEIYDPTTGTWTATEPMSQLRWSHTATALANGAILVAGGFYSGVLANSVLYISDTTAPAPPVLTAPAPLVASATPTVAGTAEAGSTVRVKLDGAEVGTASADASGAWSFTPSSSLAQGAHSATATATDAAGNTSAVSAPRSFTVDSVAPVAPVLTAPGALATPTPTVAGTAEAGSTVRVKLDGAEVGTTSADTSGAWSLSLSSPLAQGAHLVTATATDAAGNTSEPSAPRSFTVDSVAPAAPVLTAPGALVTTLTPTLAGTAEAGSTVRVKLDGAEVGTVHADASGAWSFTPSSPLAQGAHSATATATDAAGNTSEPSAPRSFTVDSVAPAAPVLTAPGALVTTLTPTLAGTAEAGSKVRVQLDGTEVGTVSANESGAWGFTPSSPLAQGAHLATATATDAAGNTSAASSPRSFTVDSLAPIPPEVLTPAAGETVTREELVFSGAAEAGSTVTVSVDGSAVGTSVADQNGRWTLTPADALAEGRHMVTATATDGAGNVSEASPAHAFSVKSHGCGCAASSSQGVLAVWAWLAFMLWTRRCRRSATASWSRVRS